MFWSGFCFGVVVGAILCILAIFVLIGVGLRKLLAGFLINPTDCRPVLQLVRLARVGILAERCLVKNCFRGAMFSSVDRFCQACPAREFCRQRKDLWY